MENKELIIKGLNHAATIIVSSLGPKGQKVALVNPHGGKSYISQDGVNIARFLPTTIHNAFERFGAELLKDAASRTVQAGGDGTTTTCLLARNIIEATSNADKSIAPKLRELAEQAVEKIKEISKAPSEDELIHMATVASRHRDDIGEMIAKLIWELGPDAHIESFPSSETSVKIKKGYEIGTGMLLPTFWRYGAKHPSVSVKPSNITLINPYVLLIEEKISDHTILVNALTKYKQKDNGVYSRPLVLVVSDIDGQALQTLSYNFAEGNIPVFPIKAPSAGMGRIDILDDLHSGCGGNVYSTYNNHKFKNFDGNFGEAELVTIYPDTSLFMFKDKYTMNVNARAEKITDEERKSKLTKGVGVINIGGSTDVEHEELKEVVEDVVLATQASLKNGVVPGGGYPFTIDFGFEESEASKIILEAFKEVFATLTKDVKVPKGKGVFNIMTGKWEDPATTSILDSRLSVTEAITNSVSLACELLATNYAIVNVGR